MDGRGSMTARPAPGRFRCLPCARIVVGTPSGHCPHCGFVPPSAPDVPDPAETTSLLAVLLVIAIALALLLVVRS